MTASPTHPVAGAGLGLRRAFLDEFLARAPVTVAFVEVAPENWLGVGGALGRKLRRVTERYPLLCHGLSLSIGASDPLDEAFLRRLKGFLDTHQAHCYTEHLAYCSDDGHLYDLMPLPFTEEAVRHVAERVRRVQDILERRIGLENVSYYAMPTGEMSESDFLCAVLEESDCGLLLDVNNIVVNAVNHGYDPVEFLHRLPGERIIYGHVAGHAVETEDLRIDTHGAAVIDPVWDLLEQSYAAFGVFPTLLERDFNIPSLSELLHEVSVITALQANRVDANDGHRAIG